MTHAKLIEKYLKELKRDWRMAKRTCNPSWMLRIEGAYRVMEKLQREIEREEKA